MNNKPKPIGSSLGGGAPTQNLTIGPSRATISNNSGAKPVDKVANTPSNYRNNNVVGTDPNASNTSSTGGGGKGTGGKSNSSSPPKETVNLGGLPKTVQWTQSQQKSITVLNRSTTSTTSIKSNSNNSNTSSGAAIRPKSAESGTNNNTKSVTFVAPNPDRTAQSQKPPASPSTLSQKPKTFPSPISQMRHPSAIRSTVSLERSRNFRSYIERAMHEHKIFSIVGIYPVIRNSLKKRGWVEKPSSLVSRSANLALSPYNSTKGDDESDVAWMTRVLRDYQPDFLWIIRRDFDWKPMSKEQLVNRFPRAWFTTKVGLAACLQHMHWFSEAGISDTFFPRCYRLCMEEERLAFQDDYRLTACMSYLRYFVDTFEKKGQGALADPHSKITPLSVDFASRQLGNYIRMRRHDDIDWLLPPSFMTQHWDAFIFQYYCVVHQKKKLRFDSPDAVRVKYEVAKKMLQKVAPFWPQNHLDGIHNMWICKPGARSRGSGIVIMNNLDKIMDLITQGNFRECNWVVQKYIERPMLIYKTKFDIRQWFLITDWTPLTVWFYKECYVRFCTKPFVLENFHESIHLCNNAIQCRYQNAEQRDANLPSENMWSTEAFQTYLKTLGRGDPWFSIYSKMKQAIVGVLLASQENSESRKGCYELYGADFMLTEDFQPWLIEINSSPCMAASTSVTARMCAQCLEDTIKVVVDRRNDPKADTGMFEMIYRQNAGSVAVQQFTGHDLTVIGKKLTRDIDWPMILSKSIANLASKSKFSKFPNSTTLQQTQSHRSTNAGNNNNSAAAAIASIPTSAHKQTLAELLQKLRVRNQEMFQGTRLFHQARADSTSTSETKSSRSNPISAAGKASNEEQTGEQS